MVDGRGGDGGCGFRLGGLEGSFCGRGDVGLAFGALDRDPVGEQSPWDL